MAAVANGQQIQIQAVEAVSLASPSSSELGHVDPTNQTGVLQPAKKIKVEQPITVSFSIPGQQLASVLTVPQGQQQSFVSLRPELVTVDCSQLYNATGTITSPTGETWTIPVYTASTQQTGFTHIAIQQDTCSDEHNNITTDVSSVFIPTGGEANKQEEVVQTVANAFFPTQLLNGNIPVTGTMGVCPNGTQTLQIWDPQTRAPEESPQVIGG